MRIGSIAKGYFNLKAAYGGDLTTCLLFLESWLFSNFSIDDIRAIRSLGAGSVRLDHQSRETLLSSVNLTMES